MTLKQDIDAIVDPVLMALRTRLQASILNYAVTAYLHGGAQMVSYASRMTGKPINFEGPPMLEAINYANKRAAAMVTKINEETRDLLRQTIETGIKDKRGIPGLTRDINKIVNDRTRAELIARTETNTALSDGSFARGKAMGVTGKKWLTVGDDKVRQSHRDNEAAGVIPFDQPFPDGSMHPPGTDPYNCRCVLLPVMLEDTE